MSDLSELYQELILDLSRRPQGYGPLLGASHQSRGQNPLCGDDVTLALILGTNQIKKIQFTGQGCAILKASASVLTKLITGRSVTVALELADDFCLALVQVSGQSRLNPREKLSKDFARLPAELKAFAGVGKFPLRVKCATLAWHALEEVLHNPTAHVLDLSSQPVRHGQE